MDTDLDSEKQIELSIAQTTSEEIEQKIWDIVKQVPGLNVGYGSVRLVIYIGKGNKKEAWSSAAGVAKGIVETAAIVACFFIAPIVTPIAAGALTGVVTDSIKGVAHVVVVMIDKPETFIQNKSSDEMEKYIYNEIKEIPAIGAVYSAARLPIYLIKGNKLEATLSGINSIFGSATSAIKCGANMISVIDKETEKALQKISQTIIPLVSKKVLEKVANEEISLEEGIQMVEFIEAKCEALTSDSSSESKKTKESELEVFSSSSNLGPSPDLVLPSSIPPTTTTESKNKTKNSKSFLNKFQRLFKCKQSQKTIEKNMRNSTVDLHTDPDNCETSDETHHETEKNILEEEKSLELLKGNVIESENAIIIVI